ncbi:MAG: hypothetical protein JWM71_649 [Solirubrobacteraceae bacterium]|nr:hypothetical protein [Solirubrobacteraceae bacterium]
MTRVCCPSCRLRFTPAVTAYLADCPQCDKPLEPVTDAAHALGLRLYVADDETPTDLPQALAAALRAAALPPAPPH